MTILRSFSIKARIALLALLPTLLALLFALQQLYGGIQLRQQMAQLGTAISYIQQLAPVLDALESEQHAVTVYVDMAEGDALAQARQTMLTERDAASSALQQFEAFLQQHAAELQPAIISEADMRQLHKRMGQLAVVRRVADSHRDHADDFKAEYDNNTVWPKVDIGRIRQDLLKSISLVLLPTASDQQLGRTANAYYLLLQAQSASALLHSAITEATQQKVSPYAFGQMMQNRALEEAYRALFVEYAPASLRDAYAGTLLKDGLLDRTTRVYWDVFDLFKSLETTPLQLSSGEPWPPLSNAVRQAYQSLGRSALDELVTLKEQKMAEAASQVLHTALILAGLLLVMSGIAVLVVRSISQPLEASVHLFNQLAASKEMGLRLDEQGQDELSSLSRAFNQVLLSFNQALGTVSAQSQDVAALAEQGSHNMQQSMQQAQHQLTSTDSISVAIHEMTSTIGEVSSIAQQTAHAVQTAHDVSVDSSQNWETSRSMMETLIDELGSTSDVVRNLNHEAAQIGGILNVIQGIAEQTNLLALNAAIEAARAGETGRGFAVVADEVRNLAGRTQESTKQIRQQIASLLSGASSATENMASLQSEGTRAVQVVLETAASFEKLRSELDTIMEMTTLIATATEEQTQVSNEINQRIAAVRDDSHALSTQAQTTTGMMTQIEEHSRQLQAAIQQFRL